jgi:hypothetical protein
MQQTAISTIRFILRFTAFTTVIALAILLITLFWPSLFMFMALYGFSRRISPKLSPGEELGSVVIVFLTSFMWWFSIGHALMFLLN